MQCNEFRRSTQLIVDYGMRTHCEAYWEMRKLVPHSLFRLPKTGINIPACVLRRPSAVVQGTSRTVSHSKPC